MRLSILFIFLSIAIQAWTSAIPSCTPLDKPAPTWDPNSDYAVSTFVRYQGRLYICLQAHHSQSGWSPPVVPALWETPTPCGVTEWQTQTHYDVGTRVTYEGKVYECIQAHTAYDSWFPPLTPALWRFVEDVGPGPNPSTDCLVEEHLGYIQTTIKAEKKAPSGEVLRANQVRAFPRLLLGDPAKPLTGKTFSSMSFFVGDKDELFDIKTVRDLDTKALHFEMHWGPAIVGAENGVIDIAPDGKVAGNIDGRAFTAPNPKSALVFADGQKPPGISLKKPDLQATLTTLIDELSAKLKTCHYPEHQILISKTVCHTESMLVKRHLMGHHMQKRSPRQRQRQQPLDRSQAPGHGCDWQQSSFNCDACKFDCAIQNDAEQIPCAAVCIATIFIACDACTNDWIPTDPGPCLRICAQNTCCPNRCGRNDNLPSCCPEGDKCLDDTTAKACASDYEPCEATTCCNANQECVHVGPQRGYCCPKDAFVNGRCCDDGDDRSLGKCCPPEKLCGNECCWYDTVNNPNSFVIVGTDCKVDPQSQEKKCCMSWEEVSEGRCCPSGTVNNAGACCRVGETNCGDNVCCPSEGHCDGKTCVVPRTDAWCKGNPSASHTDWSCLEHPDNCWCLKEVGCCRPPIN